MDEKQLEIIRNFEIKIEPHKFGIISTVKFLLTQHFPDTVDRKIEIFEKKWNSLLTLHSQEDSTDLSRYYRLLSTFKPALNTILESGQLFDMICDVVVDSANRVLDRIRNQINDKGYTPKSKKIPLPGSSDSFQLFYYCVVCHQIIEIPPEIQVDLLNSEEKHELPHHCGKPMSIKIRRLKPHTIQKEAPLKPITIYPAELLMNHINSEESGAEYLKIVSVGIDIGSSTSHLVFSRLTLKRETSFFNLTKRFNIIDRELIYEGRIIFTPLIDRNTIDIDAIEKFCKEEYQRARITEEMVDTGAVIVTGETAKKQNAAEIVQRLAHETGNFVSASAGPNFESVLGAMGSGIVEISRKNQNTILNVDIGGGTSNLALVSKGEIISTSCINIGGRLLGIDQNFKIWRMDEPTKVLMKHLNWDYHLGEVIPEEHVITLSKLYAKILMEVMQGPASSDLAKSLMMTDDLDFILPIDAISFSGGVGELIYGENKRDFNDIGKYLAEEINKLIKKTNYTLIEPNNKIRATVIGAGSFSLSVSGSTCYCDPSIKLPLENIPVVPIKISIDDLKTSYSKLKDKVAQSLKNYDLKEGKDHYALYFKDIIVRSDLELFAKALEHALPNTIRNEKLILIILGTDGGKMLGLAIKKHTAVKSNLLCLDELELKAGDWIDIGSPLRDKNAFPVTIKSLAFSGKKENI